MQVIDVITDATVLNNTIAIGSCIVRRKNDLLDKVQLFKGVWVLDAKQSFEAEILCGLKTFNLFSNSLKLKDIHEVNWVCDLEYLPNLIDKKIKSPLFESNNKTLDDFLTKIISSSNNYTLKIRYPKTSSDNKYHQSCHRICTSIRQHVLQSDCMTFDQKENLQKKINEYLKKYSDWSVFI